MAFKIKDFFRGIFPYILGIIIISVLFKILLYVVPVIFIGWMILKLYSWGLQQINSYKAGSNGGSRNKVTYYLDKPISFFTNIFYKKPKVEKVTKISSEYSNFRASNLDEKKKIVIDVQYEEVR